MTSEEAQYAAAVLRDLAPAAPSQPGGLKDSHARRRALLAAAARLDPKGKITVHINAVDHARGALRGMQDAAVAQRRSERA